MRTKSPRTKTGPKAGQRLKLDGTPNKSVSHGLSSSRTYRIWNGIIQRCENPKFGMYPTYGGVGIKVCKEWKTFVGFFEDMGHPPTPIHSIERIDNSKGYSKDNCRWATPKEQARNRKSSRWVTYKQKTKTIAEWAEELGLPQSLVGNRLRAGWSVEEAFFIKPVKGNNQALRPKEF